MINSALSRLSRMRKNSQVHVSLYMFGFGLLFAWTCMIHSTARIFPLLEPSVPSFGLLRMLSYTVELIVLVVYALHSRKGNISVLHDKRLVVIASIGGLVSTILLALGGGAFADSKTIMLALGIAGWIIWGVAAATLMYMWIKVYCAARESSSVCVYISGSLIFGAIIVYILCYIPFVTAIVAITLLPVISALFFYKARTLVEYDKAIEEENAACSKSKRFLPLSLMRLLVSIFFYTFVFYALVSPLATRRGIGLEAGSGFMLAAPLAVGLLVIVIALFFDKSKSLERIYQLVLPLMVIALLAIPFLGGTSLAGAAVLGSLGFYCFDTISWIVLYESARRKGAPPLRGFILGRITNLVGTILGSALGSVLAAQDLFRDKEFFTPICLIAVAILVFITVLLLQESVLFKPYNAADLPNDQQTAGRDSYYLESMKVAEHFGLTPRETEVFLLLARGRSNKYIEDKLVISAHTVDSHVAHIYRKCGVHSRQDIMNLVDKPSDKQR